jgi:hypothetical protein
VTPARRGALALLAIPLLVVAFHGRAAAPGQAFVGSDLRNFFFAIREATADALRRGELPGWQRGIFLGYPLLADPQAAVFDFATWLTLPWDAPRALTIATLLHLVLGGVGMAVWMRVRGLSAAAGLLAAILFALGAKQTVHLQHWNFAASTAWWPWMLAGLDAFARASARDAPARPRGRGRWLLLTAGAAAGSWFGGAAQMAYFGTLVACAHAVVLAPGLWRRRPLDAVLALVAAPLGLALAAPMVLPVLELAGLGPRGAGVDYAFATSWKWPDRWGLALLVLPRAFGGGWQRPEMNLWEATGYLGILPLALALAAPLGRRGLWLHVALAVLGVWLSFGEDAWLGLHRLFYELLPGYGSFRNPTRSLMVTAFCAALLAAEGLDALRAVPVEGRDRPWRRRALRAGIALGALALAANLLWQAPGFTLDRARAAATAPVAAGLAIAGLLWLALASRFPRWRGTAPWALAACAIALADAWLAFGTWNPVGPAAAEAPPMQDLAPLVPGAPAPRRVAVIAKWGRTANAPLRLGWEGATGYSPTVIARVRALLEATRDDRVLPPQAVTADTNFPRPDPASRLWPLLGAPIVISDQPVDLPVLGTGRPEWERPLVAYAAPALPRVYWVGAWEELPDERIAEAMLKAAGGTYAVLAPGSRTDARLSTIVPPRAPRQAAAPAPVRVEGGRLSATIDAPAPGLAVILEPWFPGWRATVGGAPARVLRANFAFIAVPVPAGRHELVLEHRSARAAVGAAIAAAALAVLAGVLALRRRAGA